jgi:polar amino acid transport system substrate-binding protein
MLKRIAVVLSLALVLAVITSGCRENKSGQLEDIKKHGQLVVYTSPGFPPFEYENESGDICGVDMDIVQRVADKLEVPLEIVPCEFGSILGKIVTGKGDIGASGFTINEERRQKVDFSVPFIVSEQYLVLLEDSEINYVEDLAGKNVAAQEKTTGHALLTGAVTSGILQNKDCTLRGFLHAKDGIKDMKDGKLDAIVIDEMAAKAYVKKDQSLKTIPLIDKNGNGLDAPEEFGMMVHKGNAELLALINEVISEMITDGSLKASLEKHLDFGKKN